MADVQLTTGGPVPADHSHTKLRPDGQQEGYVVLTPEERAKGFVKPVRRSYTHVGPPPLPTNLRDLTDEEHTRYDKFGYVKFEPYPQPNSLVGKYWIQKEIDRAGKHCGAVTTMGTALAETYARDPEFYSGTFCCACGEHFPLNEFTWKPDGEPMDVRLQSAWHVEREARQKREAQEYRTRRIAELERELAALKAQEDPA